MSAPTILCRGSGERAGDGLGHFFDNGEQHARTAFWPALALLSIPNGAKPQTEAHGKGLSDPDFLCFVEYSVRVLNVLPLARAEAADAVVRWIVAVPPRRPSINPPVANPIPEPERMVTEDRAPGHVRSVRRETGLRQSSNGARSAPDACEGWRRRAARRALLPWERAKISRVIFDKMQRGPTPFHR